MKTKLLFVFLVFTISQIQSQEKTITGIVSDDTGALPGVSVIIKGSKTGTETNFDGNYLITANVGDILQYSFVGMENVEKTVRASSNIINIVMSGNVLDEVVVVGLGLKKQRKSLTYQAEKFFRVRSNSIRASSALSGKVSGLQIKSKNYKVTSNSQIILRGLRTQRGNKNALIVVDGVVVSQTVFEKINPKDINQMKVLRGSSANALYGVEASDGVLIVSTKNSSFKMPIIEEIENESYEEIFENKFEATKFSPLSTFSIDVDKASYSNIRRMINNGQKVHADAVKIEEMVNYFNYEYAQPKGEHPFSINTEYSTCAWNKEHKLVKIGLQGKEIPMDEIPPSNLVFLLDVSGSMNSQNKLPLLKSAFKLLVNQLRNKDKVSIVVYAGAAGVVLEPTSGDDKQKILEALDNLSAGGSTAGGKGIELAYKIANDNFIKNGNNRVILATDGDFNVGMSSDTSMEKLIVEKRETGVFLTALGFGMGNYKDSKLETLADKGNGNHAYIDSMQEAQRILGKEFGGTLYTIAKDVKIQVEFNPNKIQAYRLIGYENRLLNDEDFKDDTKDAGELGSGHSVTALYEVIPVGVKSKFLKDVDELKYTKTTKIISFSDELLTVKFRYKKPDGTKSKKIVYPLIDSEVSFEETSDDFKFASAVSLFGMKMRGSKFSKGSNFEDVIELAENGRGSDKEGYRAEFIRLVKAYK